MVVFFNTLLLLNNLLRHYLYCISLVPVNYFIENRKIKSVNKKQEQDRRDLLKKFEDKSLMPIGRVDFSVSNFRSISLKSIYVDDFMDCVLFRSLH